MINVIEKYKKQIISSFGERIIDGKCVYCGNELKDGEYCTCPDAALVNRFYKKASRKIMLLREWSVVNEPLESVRKNFFLSQVHTPKKFEGMNFGNYRTENESQKEILKSVVEYHSQAVTNYLKGTNLFLFGNYGTGKTMLMSILCRSLAWDYLFRCSFVNIVDFMNDIKDTFNSNDKTVKQVLEIYRKSEFLFLDDIDKIKPTEYSKEVIYSLVNYRTEHELPTVVSANNSPEDLDEKYFGEAIISRLADIDNSKIIQFSHGNKRLGVKC